MNLPKVCDSVAVDSNEACKSFADAVKKVSDPRVVRWQGICPEGWHVMTQYEWEHTRESSSSLRSKILWEKNAGSNGSGMSIIPTGNGRIGIHEYTYMWLPMVEGAYTYSSSFTKSSFETSIVKWGRDSFQSIRCVMDANNTLIY